MPEFCTCGAQLPPDALFCHKCGKPQRELPAIEIPPAAPPPEAPPAAASRPLLPNWHNPAALRIAFLIGSLAALLGWIALLFGLAVWLLWLFGAGFLAARLYRRRTGQQLTVRAGARMGWITGILAFAVNAVMFTLSMAPMLFGGKGVSTLRDQIRAAPIDHAAIEQIDKLLQNPSGLTMLMFTGLLMIFVFNTSICALGGAVSAKTSR